VDLDQTQLVEGPWPESHLWKVREKPRNTE